MAARDLKKHTLGWIGMGRMGYPMAERLARAGCDIAVWNRTRSKAEPLAEQGATIVGELVDLAQRDIVFSMVSTSDDVKHVIFGENGVLSGDAAPKIFVDCSSISVEASARQCFRNAARYAGSRSATREIPVPSSATSAAF